MPKNLTCKLLVRRVSFGGGNVDAQVVKQYYDDKSRMHIEGGTEVVSWPEDTVIKLAGGDWGNAHIEQLLMEAQEVDQPATPELLEAPEVVVAGVKLRGPQPAVPAREATYRPRFADVEEIVWS